MYPGLLILPTTCLLDCTHLYIHTPSYGPFALTLDGTPASSLLRYTSECLSSSSLDSQGCQVRLWYSHHPSHSLISYNPPFHPVPLSTLLVPCLRALKHLKCSFLNMGYYHLSWPSSPPHLLGLTLDEIFIGGSFQILWPGYCTQFLCIFTQGGVLLV